MRAAQALQIDYLDDCLQELQLIALEALNEKIEGAKDLSSFAQRKSYEFWKNLGWRKKKKGGWHKKEKQLLEEE
jgi:hypothetical protein